MTRILITGVWLALVWMSLWESFTPANLTGGIVAAILAMVLSPPRPNANRIGFRPFAGAKLLAVFAWKLIQASVIVAWEVATPGDNTRPAVISVPLHTDAAGIVAAVANMVSLTPGTLTIEVDPSTATLFIHVLHNRSYEATRAEVYQLERLTLAAFPPGAQAT